MRILRELGVLEDIMKKAGLPIGLKLDRRGWFKFYSGTDNEELILDVCVSD